MAQPLLSVIIPAYNVEHYLENCLNSVLNQSYSNIEILLVDDGSTDNTGKIADHYQEVYSDRLKAIHTENRGVTMARFEGFNASSGEWIGFTDSDDEIEPDMYERLIDNAVKYDVEISHCGHKTIVNGGERIHEFYNTGRLEIQNKREGMKSLLNGQFEPSLWTKLYRRDLLSRVVQDKVINTSIKYNEDILMNYYLFKLAERTVLEDFCGYHYLARDDSATRKEFQKEKVLDPVKVRRQILDDASKEFKDIAERNYLTACMNAYEALYNHPEFVEDYKKLKKILNDNHDKWQLLRKKELLKLRILMKSPWLYHHLYLVYSNTLQKKQYE